VSTIVIINQFRYYIGISTNIYNRYIVYHMVSVTLTGNIFWYYCIHDSNPSKVFGLHRRKLHEIDGFHNIAARHGNTSLSAAHSSNSPGAEVVLQLYYQSWTTEPGRRGVCENLVRKGIVEETKSIMCRGINVAVDTFPRSRAKNSGKQ